MAHRMSYEMDASNSEDLLTLPRPPTQGANVGSLRSNRIPSAGQVTIAQAPSQPKPQRSLSYPNQKRFPAILAESGASDTDGSDTGNRRQGAPKQRRRRRKKKGGRTQSQPGKDTSRGTLNSSRGSIRSGSAAAASRPRTAGPAVTQSLNGSGANMTNSGSASYPFGGGLGNMQQVAVSPRDNKRPTRNGPFDPLRSMVITPMGGRSSTAPLDSHGIMMSPRSASTIPTGSIDRSFGDHGGSMGGGMGSRGGDQHRSPQPPQAALDFSGLAVAEKPSSRPGHRPSPRRARSAPAQAMKIANRLRMRTGKASFEALLSALAATLGQVDPVHVGPQELLGLHHNYMQRICKCFSLLDMSIQASPQERMLELSKILCSAAKAEQAFLFLISPNENEVYAYTNQSEVRLPLEGIFSAVRGTEKSINIRDASTDKKYDKTLNSLLQIMVEHCVVAPVTGRDGKLVGFSMACNRVPLTEPEQFTFNVQEGFTDFDEGILNTLAQPIGKYLDDVERFSSLEREKRQQSEMLQLAKELSSVLDLFSLIRLVMDQARDILQADRCALFLVDHAAGELWAPVADGGSVISFPIGSGIAGFVAENGTVVNIPDAYADDRFNKDIDVKTGYRTRSILCMPVFNREGLVIGVTQMLNKKNGSPFSTADEHLLDMYSTFSGIGLQNSQLYNASIRESRKARILLEVSSALSSSLDLNSLIAIIMDSAKQLLNADRCTLFLKSEDGTELWSRVADGTQEIRIPVDAGIAGHVATSGEILNIPDAYEHPLFNKGVDIKTGYRTKSILCMPIKDNENNVIGVAQMINKKGSKQRDERERKRARSSTVALTSVGNAQMPPEVDTSGDPETPANAGAEAGYLPFTNDDMDLLEAFTSQAAISIVNCNLYTKTAEMGSYLESVLNSIQSGVVTIDLNGCIVTSNSSEVLRKTAEKAGITGPLDKKHYTEWLAHNQVIMEAITRVGETDQPTFGYQYIWLDEAGALAATEVTAQSTSPSKAIAAKQHDEDTTDAIHINFMVHPLMNENHQRTGTVLVLEDISPQQKMMLTLSRYMSTEKAEQVMSDQGSRLGGVSQKTTILFSDIRGYTKMSEFHEPAHVVQTLNEYFEHMAGAVLDHGGIIDKYIGDAIMAVFGCPYPKQDDALRAVRAAVAMKHGVREFNMLRQEKGLEPILNIGVGVSTGDVVSGNIGTTQRMEYTVIGHAVNLASRVEGATKKYGVGVLISEYTHKDIKEHFVCREVDFVRVVGAQVPVHMYEVLVSRLDDICLAQTVLTNLDLWRVALKDYRQANFLEAKANFSEFLRNVPGDKPAQMHLDRCIAFLKKPPSADWDCAHDLTSK